VDPDVSEELATSIFGVEMHRVRNWLDFIG
jgi:hypothetical protein